jgi:hypothetical protein
LGVGHKPVRLIDDHATVGNACRTCFQALDPFVTLIPAAVLRHDDDDGIIIERKSTDADLHQDEVARRRRQRRGKSGHLTAGPWLYEVELYETSNPLKVSLIVGHEHTAGFSTRECEQDIIRERFRETGDFESLSTRHFCEQVPRSMPGISRRRDCPIRSLEDLEDVPLQRLPVPGPSHTSPQLLGDDHAEMLKRRKGAMEPLEFFVDNRIAKRVDEELGVENVLARGSSHLSASGGAISIPSIARVPSTSSR